MTIVLVSFFSVALAEFGDKTQLFAMVMAAQFKKPLPILAGILCATIANHTVAAIGGYYLADFLEGFWFRLVVALSFLAMAAWTALPDRGPAAPQSGRTSAFLATLIGIFILEIGDKTQVATVALAAHYHSVVLVTIGTTLGMMSADTLAVYLTQHATNVAPLRFVRFAAAAIFAVLGAWDLLELIHA